MDVLLAVGAVKEGSCLLMRSSQRGYEPCVECMGFMLHPIMSNCSLLQSNKKPPVMQKHYGRFATIAEKLQHGPEIARCKIVCTFILRQRHR